MTICGFLSFPDLVKVWKNKITSEERRGSLMFRSPADREVRVQTSAGDNLLCSWARHLTLTVPLSTQLYIK